MRRNRDHFLECSRRSPFGGMRPKCQWKTGNKHHFFQQSPVFVFNDYLMFFSVTFKLCYVRYDTAQRASRKVHSNDQGPLNVITYYFPSRLNPYKSLKKSSTSSVFSSHLKQRSNIGRSMAYASTYPHLHSPNIASTTKLPLVQ